jgi:hypothetical protein
MGARLGHDLGKKSPGGHRGLRHHSAMCCSRNARTASSLSLESERPRSLPGRETRSQKLPPLEAYDRAVMEGDDW